MYYVRHKFVTTTLYLNKDIVTFQFTTNIHL